MPSSVRSTCSSSADRRRLSQSLNRVSMLGRLSGIDAAALPPLRTDSPMTVMQDQLRSLYGAPSTESLNSVDAVVTQMSRPGEDAAALTGPESGRHNIRPARSDSARSQHSAGTTTTSRSRARKETLCRQQQQQSSAASVYSSRPPLSHPEILAPGGHARARSEAAIRMGSTARKRQSMAMKGGQGRQSLAVAAPDLPDWLAQTFTGSRFASEPAAAAPLPPVPSIPADRRESMACDARRSSTTTVVPETPRAAKTTREILRDTRRRSTVSKSLCGDDDDLKSIYSTRSAATTSYAPRNFSRPMEKKQPQHIVREQGVNFEMVTPPSSANPSPRSFKKLSIVIPPSQSSSSSFSVRSVTRSTTPPMVSATPSPARTVSSSSADSVASSRGRTRTSTMSSATTVSRSPSPARGSYNPANDKSILTSVERSSDSYKRYQPAVQQSRSTEPRRVMPPANPRYSVVPPTMNASSDASFATRATAAQNFRRAPAIQTRGLPCPHPNPLASHPVNFTSSRREQKPEDLRKPAAREAFVHQPARCETPPLFGHTLKRSDSLFLGSDRTRVSEQQFFPEWSQPSQRQPAKFEAYRKAEDDLAGPVDDRRMLPSQKRSVSPAASLQRVAMTNAHVARSSPANMMPAAHRLGSTRSLRKTTAIDFASLRGENN